MKVMYGVAATSSLVFGQRFKMPNGSHFGDKDHPSTMNARPMQRLMAGEGFSDITAWKAACTDPSRTAVYMGVPIKYNFWECLPDAGCPECPSSRGSTNSANFAPYGTGAGDTKFPTCDDCAVTIDFTSPFIYQGSIFNEATFVDNGPLYFAKQSDLSATFQNIMNSMGTDAQNFQFHNWQILPLTIAAYWTDINLNLGGDIWYGQNDGSVDVDQIVANSNMDRVRGTPYESTWNLIITVDKVAAYWSMCIDRSNTYQIILTSNGDESYVFINYGDIEYDHGFTQNDCVQQEFMDAACPADKSQRCQGRLPAPTFVQDSRWSFGGYYDGNFHAMAGINGGATNGGSFLPIDGSGSHTMIDVEQRSNIGVTGQFGFIGQELQAREFTNGVGFLDWFLGNHGQGAYTDPIFNTGSYGSLLEDNKGDSNLEQGGIPMDDMDHIRAAMVRGRKCLGLDNIECAADTAYVMVYNSDTDMHSCDHIDYSCSRLVCEADLKAATAMSDFLMANPGWSGSSGVHQSGPGGLGRDNCCLSTLNRYVGGEEHECIFNGAGDYFFEI